MTTKQKTKTAKAAKKAKPAATKSASKKPPAKKATAGKPVQKSAAAKKPVPKTAAKATKVTKVIKKAPTKKPSTKAKSSARAKAEPVVEVATKAVEKTAPKLPVETKVVEIATPAAKPTPAPAAESKAIAAPKAQKAAKASKPAPTAWIPVPDEGEPDEGAAAVDAFLRDATHPLKDAFAAVRKLILEVSPSIEEGIKWSAPSFKTTEWFATFFLREPEHVKIVFHLGAKKQENGPKIQVGAPAGMVEWLAADRCMVTLAGAADVKRRGKALQAFVRAWILHV